MWRRNEKIDDDGQSFTEKQTLFIITLYLNASGYMVADLHRRWFRRKNQSRDFKKRKFCCWWETPVVQWHGGGKMLPKTAEQGLCPLLGDSVMIPVVLWAFNNRLYCLSVQKRWKHCFYEQDLNLNQTAPHFFSRLSSRRHVGRDVIMT